jgi:hypothetical protein
MDWSYNHVTAGGQNQQSGPRVLSDPVPFLRVPGAVSLRLGANLVNVCLFIYLVIYNNNSTFAWSGPSGVLGRTG